MSVIVLGIFLLECEVINLLGANVLNINPKFAYHVKKYPFPKKICIPVKESSNIVVLQYLRIFNDSILKKNIP